MKKDDFQNLIRRILKEEVEKRSVTDQTIYQRLPEVVHGEDYKKLTPHPREDLSKNDLLAEMDKVVKAIDANYTVVWDDHDDLTIAAQDLMRIRIIPKWENNFCIETFTRNEDRVYITGQTWKQVKEFVKENLSQTQTCTDKDYDKSFENYEDKVPSPDKGMPQKDKPKIKEPLKDTKNKDKDYNEKLTKRDEDLPEKPMKEVKDFKKQVDHKVKDPIKLRKKHDNDKHFVKMN
jgi:hypothetical protein